MGAKYVSQQLQDKNKTVDILEWKSYDTVLDYLGDNHIFGINPVKGGFEIFELCDRYHGVVLNADGLDKLIEELQKIRTRMK